MSGKPSLSSFAEVTNWCLRRLIALCTMLSVLFGALSRRGKTGLSHNDFSIECQIIVTGSSSPEVVLPKLSWPTSWPNTLKRSPVSRLIA